MQELGGSIARQLAQTGQWKYFIPWTSCSVYKPGLARGRKLPFLSCFWEFESLSWLGVQTVFWAANGLSGGEKNCVVYSLFCIFIIFIVIIITIISISFVDVLNCLYLNSRVFPFVHFSSPSH